jgi:hypothetical protein
VRKLALNHGSRSTIRTNFPGSASSSRSPVVSSRSSKVGSAHIVDHWPSIMCVASSVQWRRP